ncbi:MAG: cobalamin biosynthesis protein [Alphaproteobacteria bacterium]|nr:cobalamin biosynthesis protein [Alphaproteobacteria bacterium]MBU0886425.1 cobalamin biosynthesis protein [Alphaproteobacteria bacterium]
MPQASCAMLLFDGLTTETLILLIAALAIDAYAGGLRWPAPLSAMHPGKLAERAARWFDDRLNRAERSPLSLRLRGTLVLLVLLAIALAVGGSVQLLARVHGLGWAIALMLMVMLVALRQPYDRIERVRRTLQSDSLDAARQSIDSLTDRDIYKLDDHSIARLAVEAAGERFVLGVAAPVLWTILFGLPGLLAQAVLLRAAATLRRPDRDLYGKGLALAARLLIAPASWMAGVILCIAAIAVPTAKPMAGLSMMLRDGGKGSLPHARALAALAGALDFSLGGPRLYAQRSIEDAWIGSGRARLLPDDIRRTLMLYAIACVVTAGLIAVVIIATLRS